MRKCKPDWNRPEYGVGLRTSWNTGCRGLVQK